MSSITRRAIGAAVVSVTLLGFTVQPAGAATFSGRMTGEAEVPGPGDPDGRGRFTIMVFPERHRVCYSLHWERIASPMMAHIHKGGAAVAGDVKVTLFSQNHPLPREIHTVKGCVDDLKTRLLKRIKNHPARFYVNVHNRPFPNGALRGQLV